ncbi:penicillin amidase [Nonlabens dokdonensis]|uniref:Penicillin acylase II n=2 Tax=Nonlabens dokdonensis TaxID=328515 RepID=L7W1B7_NONDD|nr:penicillin acylase family protein [Nonlabens dokdonensis]AGC75275.1 Penicillin acylase II precursor [Nonlabens dokdonensis DSW-6]PZX38988.1 penicillin amidase [Nonlabens dokdonensis]
MKIGRLSVALSISLLWIFATNYAFFPISDIASLLTFKSGLLGVNTSSDMESEVGSVKELMIKIDTYGIPYIYSENDNDIAYGLGYMHAKDRYFQMELMIKMVKGELSEILGERVLGSDNFWRPFEFDGKAKEVLEEFKTSSPELYSYLLNYSEGINKYLEKNRTNDPLYKIFNLEPQKWKPEYSLLTAWYMSSNLAYFDYHGERQELLDKVPNEILDILYPQRSDELKTILPSNNKVSILKEPSQLEKVALNGLLVSTTKFNTDIGSNNWVVNSLKSNTKEPLIVNDPHLFLTLPGAFYEVGLFGNTIKSYGYTIPGVPVVISGHNTTISWGITNGEWDLTDRYLLKTKNDSLYLYQGNWIPFQEKQYSIEVRGKEKEVFNIKSTIHGRVIKEDSTYYAQKWYPSSKNYSIKALFNVMKSKSFNEFKNVLKIYDYPPQNFIYADVRDTIGIVCAGKLPKRPQGFQGGLLDGTLKPLSEGYITKQWETSNPRKNYLFSANQLPIQNDYYFGAHWHKDSYRVNHIDNILNNKNNWSVEDFMVMQLDEVDISFLHLKEVFLDQLSNPEISSIGEAILNWDGNMKSNSKEAYIYEILRRSTEIEARRFAQQELGVQQSPSMESFLNYLDHEISTKGQYSNKETIINNILRKTDSMLAQGNDKNDKAYNSISEVIINNISFLPGFEYKVLDAGGNKNTINMNASAHPTFRSIYKMKANNIKGYTIMAGGQSGKLNSKNYADQINGWKNGNYKETQFVENPEELKNITTTIYFK